MAPAIADQNKVIIGVGFVKIHAKIIPNQIPAQSPIIAVVERSLGFGLAFNHSAISRILDFM